jgi:hypothetical protein
MNIFGTLQNQTSMNTPNRKPSGTNLRKPSATNLNNDLGGGAFLTETKPMSRMNLNTKSPDGRKTSTEDMMNMSPSPHFVTMTNTGSL